MAAATVLYRPDIAILDGLLAPLEAAGLRIFIFANGPLAAAVEERLARVPDLALIRSPENVGLGAGLNEMVAAAQAENFRYVLLFDQDSAPSPDLPAKLLERFELLLQTSPTPPAALGPSLTAPEAENFLPPWYSYRPITLGPEVTAVDFLPTSGTLLSIPAFAAIGPFRADYFIDGIDVEWCFRAWANGHACARANELVMAHRWGHAADDHSRRPQILRQPDLRSFYYLRNAIYGLRLPHLPWRWKLRTGLRLAVQSSLLLADRHFTSRARRLVRQALTDGWLGRLGPAPPRIAKAD